jgi:hypothetical protein
MLTRAELGFARPTTILVALRKPNRSTPEANTEKDIQIFV